MANQPSDANVPSPAAAASGSVCTIVYEKPKTSVAVSPRASTKCTARNRDRPGPRHVMFFRYGSRSRIIPVQHPHPHQERPVMNGPTIFAIPKCTIAPPSTPENTSKKNPSSWKLFRPSSPASTSRNEPTKNIAAPRATALPRPGSTAVNIMQIDHTSANAMNTGTGEASPSTNTNSSEAPPNNTMDSRGSAT